MNNKMPDDFDFDMPHIKHEIIHNTRRQDYVRAAYWMGIYAAKNGIMPIKLKAAILNSTYQPAPYSQLMWLITQWGDQDGSNG